MFELVIKPYKETLPYCDIFHLVGLYRENTNNYWEKRTIKNYAHYNYLNSLGENETFFTSPKYYMIPK